MPDPRRRAPSPFPADLPALTALRFWLALGVVLFHYSVVWPYDLQAVTGLVERARLGVDVFFVLSGFILTHVYQGRADPAPLDYPRFLIARLARIYPAHLAVLAFATALVAGGTLAGAAFEHAGYTFGGWWRTLLLVHAWAPTAQAFEWNGPTWSLSAEWFAYLLFPLFAWLGLKLRQRPGVLLAVALAAFLSADAAYRAAFGQPLTHAEFNLGVARIAPEFLFGVALYRLGERLSSTAGEARWGAALAVAAMLALMHAGADERLIVAAAGAVVLALGLLAKAGAGMAFDRPWMRLAGEASYALYVVHFPMILAWNGAVEALGLRGSAPVMAWPETLALLSLTLAAALGLHLGVERPARSLVRAWMARPAPAPALA